MTLRLGSVNNTMVYRFLGNVLTFITTLHMTNVYFFFTPEMKFQSNLNVI